MKNRIVLCYFTIIFVIFIFQQPNIYSEENKSVETIYILEAYQDDWKLDEIADRIYIKPEALNIVDNGIYLMVIDYAIPLETISVDDCGIYISSTNFGVFGWRCEFCQVLNPSLVNTCQNCGKERP